MKVILTERVQSLGNIGEIVNVSAGYARNFLMPNGFALIADDSNTRLLKAQQKSLAKKVQAEKDAAIAVKKQLESMGTLELIKKVGANGKLFGTLTTTELSKELETKGLHVERRLIHFDSQIKGLGVFGVKAKLFADVEASFKVKIAIDPKQAEELKKAQEEAVKAAEARKKAQAEAKNDDSKTDGKVELTEEQRLKAEVDRLLRN